MWDRLNSLNLTAEVAIFHFFAAENRGPYEAMICCYNVVNWKGGMEVKVLKVNIVKSKVMLGRSSIDRVDEQGKWPCDVC